MSQIITDLDNRFVHHPPDEEKAKLHAEVRGECHNLAAYLVEVLPPGRECSLAITKLEEVMFWANASLARK